MIDWFNVIVFGGPGIIVLAAMAYRYVVYPDQRRQTLRYGAILLSVTVLVTSYLYPWHR
jgi:hypothetical protein